MSHWSEDELQAVARGWLVDKKGTRQLAAELGRSKSAVYRLIERNGWKGHQGDTILYASLYRDYDYDPEAPKLRPISIKLPPRPAVEISSTEQVSLHWGDTHFPFEDKRSINILYQIAEELEPDVLVCHGDVADMWQISDHRPPVGKRLRSCNA